MLRIFVSLKVVLYVFKVLTYCDVFHNFCNYVIAIKPLLEMHWKIFSAV